jgi:phospholipid transport system substrate-binding protein
MNRTARPLALLAFAAALVLSNGSRADEAAPKYGPAGPATAAVKAASERLRKTIHKLAEAKEVDWKRAREEARSAVASLLDFDALAEGTLGTHWAEVKKVPADRKRYVDAMRSAMEASYLSKMQGKAEPAEGKVKETSADEKRKAIDDVKIDYLGESKDQAGHDVVHTTVNAGKDKVSIGYAMAKVGKEWKAVDLLTEDISLAETYRDQINTLWPKKHFDGVVAAFEKKAKRFEQELEERRKK